MFYGFILEVEYVVEQPDKPREATRDHVPKSQSHKREAFSN